MALPIKERIIYQELTDEFKCGIYGIYANDRLMYIGQSAHMEDRWKAHSTYITVGHFTNNAGIRRQATLHCLWENGFTISFKVLRPCEPAQLNQLEREYIEQYQPMLNTVHNPVEMEKYKERMRQQHEEILAHMEDMEEWYRKAVEYWGSRR